MSIDELLSGYKFKTLIQVRFKDVDKQGHVNNANHLTYFEISRTDYFKEIFRKTNDWNKTGMILAHTEVTYKTPITLEDTIFCFTKVSRFGTKSFDMENVLAAKTAEGYELRAYGKSILVCMDYEKKETVNVPQDWIVTSTEFEQGILK
ncbi:MAG: acyl-CoA thioesterase [Bacteroidota bacterium]